MRTDKQIMQEVNETSSAIHAWIVGYLQGIAKNRARSEGRDLREGELGDEGLAFAKWLVKKYSDERKS